MKKIVIIGAGPAGLTAGYELSKNKEYEVVINKVLKEMDNIPLEKRTATYLELSPCKDITPKESFKKKCLMQMGNFSSILSANIA